MPDTHLLWLALEFHRLALDEIGRGEERPLPVAVYDSSGSRQWVHACNAEAARAGVAPGMKVGAALGMCGGLLLHPRRPDREAAALAGLAAWAGQFSDYVSIAPPDQLLLEIGGSLQLFGGFETLAGQIAAGVAALGFEARAGVAPTPLGAALLARAGVAEPAFDRAALERRLERLPLALLEQPPESIARLHGLGLRRVGDCLRLPRDALARRLGAPLLDYLDRAFGRRPDPRPRYTPPERFAQTLWLPAEVQQTEALLFASRRLLLALAGFLRARGAAVPSFTLTLMQVRRPPATIEIGLVAPSRDPEHLLGLLRERLGRRTLAAPVEGLRVEAERLTPLGQSDQGLFAPEGEPPADWERWVERLRARLGNDAVYTLEAVADHRPDRAWRRVRPTAAQAPARKGAKRREEPAADSLPAGPRPLWLLPEPLPLPPGLDASQALPYERIESGWWDGSELTGDYLCLALPDGRYAWVLRPQEGGEEKILGFFG